MKNLRFLAVIAAMMLMVGMLAACQAPEAQPSDSAPSVTHTPKEYSFEAIVLAVSEWRILVGPMTGEAEIIAATEHGIVLNPKLQNGDTIPQLEVGMIIRVTYNGIITYSIPAQINGLYSVEILEQVSN